MFFMRIRRVKRNKVLLTIALVLLIAQSRIGIETPELISDTFATEEIVASANKPSSALSLSQNSRPEPLEYQTQQDQPLDVVISAQKKDLRASELDKIVQPITTVTEFIGGQEERNRGSGFVVGNRFFTVNHNLTTSFPSLRVKSTSFIDGISVERPVFADERQDVAVFDRPGNLCLKHCNSTKLAQSPDLNTNRKVYWLRKFQDDFILKEATILQSVTFGDVSSSESLTTSTMSCSNNSVVLVDEPFIPGSSGSPVMDAETGKIIGVIQGSVDDGNVEKGYFKPINCVLAMLHAMESSDTFARL